MIKESELKILKQLLMTGLFALYILLSFMCAGTLSHILHDMGTSVPYTLTFLIVIGIVVFAIGFRKLK